MLTVPIIYPLQIITLQNCGICNDSISKNNVSHYGNYTVFSLNDSILTWFLQAHDCQLILYVHFWGVL